MTGAVTVLLVGYYGVGNLGDDVLRHAIEAGLASRGVTVTAWTAWGDRDPDPRGIRIRPNPLRVLRAVRRADAVVLGGGGILKDEGRRMPIELLAIAVTARLLRRPVVLLGVGVGPFRTRLGPRLAAWTARLCRPRLVRDADSRDLLASLGVKGVVAIADPVLGMPRPPSVPVRHGILVAPRHWSPAGSSWPALAAGMADALTVATEAPTHHPHRAADVRPSVTDPARIAGRELLFVGLYWPRDRDASLEIVRHLHPGGAPLVDAVGVADGPVTWDDLTTLMAGRRLAIVMRYHALVAAALTGTPAVAVAYEPKVRELAHELRIPAVDLSAGDWSDRLRETIRTELRRHTDGETAPPPSRESIDRLRASVEKGLDAAAKAIRGL